MGVRDPIEVWPVVGAYLQRSGCQRAHIQVGIAVVNGGNLAVIDELLAPDFVDHGRQPGVPPTRDGTKAIMAMLHKAFPDLNATVDDVIAEGDKVVQRTTSHGTMKGEFAGMPPSGKSAT